MATLLSIATGNFTSSSTWALCDSTSENDSQATTFNVSTSNQDSTAFTPGAITVDAVAVRVNARNSTSGTVTITLRNSTGAVDVDSVTVNASDFDLQSGADQLGWYVFKFSSSHLLLAATNYLIRVVCSTGNPVTFYSSTGTNICRQLRTTTTQAPAAGDKLIVAGEHTGAATGNSFTITMDNTATTSFGAVAFNQSLSINKRSTLIYGTAASTNYYLKVQGITEVFSSGTFNIGTSGTPIPSTSTAVLEFNSTTTTLDSGMNLRCGSVFTAYGATKTTLQTKMTADKAVAATVIALVDTTDWAAGDIIAFASTTATATQAEKKTILTVDSSTQVTLTAGLTNAHGGTAPFIAEVGNLTRNVKIRGIDSTHTGYVHHSRTCSSTMRYVEFTNLGGNVTHKFGISCAVVSGCTVDIQFCSTYDLTVSIAVPFYWETGSTAAFTYSNNVVYNVDTNLQMTDDSTAPTMSNNLFIRCGGMHLSFFGTYTYLNNVLACGTTVGLFMDIGTTPTIALSASNFSGWTFHTGSNSTFRVNLVDFPVGSVITNFTCWNWAEIVLVGRQKYGLEFSGCTFYGTYIQLQGSTGVDKLVLTNCNFNNTALTAFGFGLQLDENPGLCIINGCQFGVLSTGKTAYTAGDVGLNATSYGSVIVVGSNSIFANASPFHSVNPNVMQSSRMSISGWGQVQGSHRTIWAHGGIEINDTVIFKAASPSERLTPATTAMKMASGPKQVAVSSGDTVTIGVWVRKSTSTDAGGANYNGAQQRLILSANPEIGISADTILLTASAAVGVWEQLTAVTSAVTADGVLNFYTDCDGTAGWVNVDDWSAT